MVFHETTLQGAWLIEPERIEDERGFFARLYCAREFAARGLNDMWAQSSISFNLKKGTLRGMHWQAAPHEEVKLVRCTTGMIYDVIADPRPGSPSFRQWAAFELTAENRRMLYIPTGMAHGFQTLADNSEVHYQISAPFHPELQRGFPWDDPAFGIEWPALTSRVISEKDRTLPAWKEHVTS